MTKSVLAPRWVRHGIALRFALPIAAGLSLSAALGADTWDLPERTTVESPGGTFAFTVIPSRDFGIGETMPLGILERRPADSERQLAWIRTLPNPVAPVGAVVAADGRWVVTLDDVPMAGFGDLVVVAYDHRGRKLRNFALDEIFAEEEIAAFPRTVSSIWWRCAEPGIDVGSSSLVLPVYGTESTCMDVALDLRSGRRAKAAAPSNRPNTKTVGTASMLSATRMPSDRQWEQQRNARFEQKLSQSPPMVRAVRSTALSDSDAQDTEPAALAAVERALREGADVDAIDPDGGTPLRWALDLGLLRVARLLIENGADMDQAPPRSSLFDLVIQSGDPDLVRAALAAGADPNRIPGDHHTPLTLAATFQLREITEILIRAGADPNRRGEFESPLEAALWGTWWDGSKLLLAAGARPDALPPDLKLRWAVEAGNREVALQILDAAPRFDPEEQVLERSLARAAERGDAQMVRLLLDRGVDPNIGSGLFETTPLIEAAKGGRIDAMRELLDGGARVNAADKYGFRPIDAAALFAQAKAVSWLRTHGGADGIELGLVEGGDILK